MSVRRRRQPSPFSVRSEDKRKLSAGERSVKRKSAAGSASRKIANLLEGSRRFFGVRGLTLFFFDTTQKNIDNNSHHPTMENNELWHRIGSMSFKEKNIREPGSQPESCGKKIKESENLAGGGAGKTPGNWKQFKPVRSKARGREEVRN